MSYHYTPNRRAAILQTDHDRLGGGTGRDRNLGAAGRNGKRYDHLGNTMTIS